LRYLSRVHFKTLPTAGRSTTAGTAAAEAAKSTTAATAAPAATAATAETTAASATHQHAEDKAEEAAAAGFRDKNQKQDEEDAADDDLAEGQRLGLRLLLARLGIPLRIEFDAGVCCDDLRDRGGGEDERAVVVLLAEVGNHLAADAADLAVGQDALEAVADFNAVLVVVDREEDEDAAVCALGADLPAFFQFVDEVIDVLIADALDGDDCNLRVGTLVDLAAEQGEGLDGLRGEDAGEVVDVAAWLQLV